MIGRGQGEAQHPEDRPQKALRLTKGQVEDEPERQRGFDGNLGVLQLPSARADAHGLPRGDRFRRQPQGDVASLDQCSVVRRPVSDAVFRFVPGMHSRLHVEIMPLRPSRWPGPRRTLVTAHQRRWAPPRTTCWPATSADCSKPRPFTAKGYRKAWAKLRVAGIRTSKERVRRLMREHDLQAPHRVGHAHGPKAHDGTITTAAPDVMWGTDMTATVTVGEGAAFVFVAVDHCTTECIGLHAAKRGTRFEALEPIRQGVRARFGTIGEGVARGLRLRHDHGSNYLADDFQQEVAFFGIESSPSFVREPEGHGVAERFIRTLKENLLWVRSFATIEALRLALLAFKRTYNEQWMLEKYDYRSPAQVRRDLVGLDAAA